MQWVEYHGWLAGIEGRVLDIFLIREKHSEPGDDIVLVKIDEQARQTCFCGRIPLTPAKLVAVVEGVLKAEPRVIGVDIETVDGSYQKLVRKLSHKDKVVWAAAAEEASTVSPDFLTWLLGGSDEVRVIPGPVLGVKPENQVEFKWGVPVYPPDEDNVVRRLPRAVEASLQLVPSWPRKIADVHRNRQFTDKEPSDVYITYKKPPVKEFALLDLFSCRAARATANDRDRLGCNPDEVVLKLEKEQELRDAAKGKVVLIGTTDLEGDRHITPIDQDMPGLLVNAYAIQSEIDRSTVDEMWRLVTFLLDCLIGSGILLLLSWMRPRHLIRRMMTLNLMWIAFAIWLSDHLMKGHVWFSCVAVAAGVIVGLLVDIWRENPVTRRS
jgi:CHASE2 domain-containing sensor protein